MAGILRQHVKLLVCVVCGWEGDICCYERGVDVCSKHELVGVAGSHVACGTSSIVALVISPGGTLEFDEVWRRRTIKTSKRTSHCLIIIGLRCARPSLDLSKVVGQSVATQGGLNVLWNCDLLDHA